MDTLAFHAGPLPSAILTVRPDPHFGAVASFVGIVRDHHHGRVVTALHYQAHPHLGLGVLRRLTDALRATIATDLHFIIIHATGDLRPCDAAIVIHAASAHRHAALRACSEAIEAIKRDLPVWKCETYDDGSSHWMEGS